MVFLIFPTLISWLLKEVLHIGLQLQCRLQVTLQGRWFGLLTLLSWRAICWGMGRAALREGPVMPPALPLGPLSLLVPTSGRGMDIQPVPSNGPAQSLNLFFQGHHGCQGPLVGLTHLGKLSCSQMLPPMGFCFVWRGCQQIQTFPVPLVVCPLSTSGHFSKRTLHHLPTHLPILVHMVWIQAVSWVHRLGSISFLFLLCWCGVHGLHGRDVHLWV